ncbi:hemin uptake protein HemP [Dongia rigui]|uniref:Hemin uptake protein HemP n=1 Tax=Dongia rigui TaxID=940149 RepID=A0ABU5E1H6_9PROT|nr:hemin uptake protein HemP [Dongia rigui]MDY0873405.1 hemin uptake protein HemP [Dongia rigui]
MDRDGIDFHRPTTHSAPSVEVEVRSLRNHLLPRSSQRPATPARQPVQTVNLQSILKGAREAIIDFEGSAYRLRITRNHRLILTK